MGKLTSLERKLAHRDGQNVSKIETRNFELQPVARIGNLLGQPLSQAMSAKVMDPFTVYWVYLGRTQRTVIVDKMQILLAAPGDGTQVMEAGLITTKYAAPSSPGTGTVIAISPSFPFLTTPSFGGPVPRQSNGIMNCSVPPCTYLWAFVHVNFGTNQPSFWSYSSDWGLGLSYQTTPHSVPVVLGEQLVPGSTGADTASTPVYPYVGAICRE